VPEVIRARDVRVRLGHSLVVQGVDLSVNHGEAVALMGANGSGKSTLVRALVGILPIESGSVDLFGARLLPSRRGLPWHRTGYVPQRVSAAGGVPATALEVVTSGLLYRGRLRLPRNARGLALEALDEVGLAGRAGSSVRELSGGQQQRVLIARALVRRPDLLLLDEPVAGVDRQSQVAFAQTLAALVERQVTVLVVLHELGSFAPLIGRTVVLRHGLVVHDGPPLPPAPGHDAPDHVHLHPHVEAPGRRHARALTEPTLGSQP
jgi:zinc transport system ATP-binding protein